MNRKALGKKLRQIAEIEEKQRKGEDLNTDQVAKLALKQGLESLMGAGKSATEKDLARKKHKHSGVTAASTEDAPKEKAARRKKKKKKKPDDSEKLPEADKISREQDIASREAMTVIIGGLPYGTPDDKLSRMFGKCGEILKLNVPRNRETGLARGFCFVTFKTQEGVEAALQFDGKTFNDRRLTARSASNKPESKKGGDVEVSGNSSSERSLFVGGLPHDVTEESVRKYFSDVGEIETLKLPLNEEGQPKGYAFITLKDTGLHRIPAKALKLSGCDFEGYSIVVRLAGDGGGKSDKGSGKGQGKDKGSGKGPVELTVFVQGLHRSTTEEKVRKVFSKCGATTHVKMPMWDEGQSRGFAFISYKDKAAVDKALKLNNTNESMSYNDCFMSVKMAVDHEQAVSMRDGRKDQVTKVPEPKERKKVEFSNDLKELKQTYPQSVVADVDPEDNPKVTGALVKSTGKRLAFDDSDDEE